MSRKRSALILAFTLVVTCLGLAAVMSIAIGAVTPAAAQDAVSAIQSAVDNLAAHPLIGHRIEGELRELVISYGQTGYVALCRFVVSQDEVRVLAIRHQRELGFQP
jgi:plasmid stabilization system protein ParE